MKKDVIIKGKFEIEDITLNEKVLPKKRRYIVSDVWDLVTFDLVFVSFALEVFSNDDLQGKLSIIIGFPIIFVLLVVITILAAIQRRKEDKE